MSALPSRFELRDLTPRGVERALGLGLVTLLTVASLGRVVAESIPSFGPVATVSLVLALVVWVLFLTAVLAHAVLGVVGYTTPPRAVEIVVAVVVLLALLVGDVVLGPPALGFPFWVAFVGTMGLTVLVATGSR
ncbi:hypothetical protein ACFO0N_13160 [Halobium salinum]|uniref:Uncharacterized protein n=1 Tax=Halobium salinum TaxID=1364940 RepID=A0ABD5PDB2_9EURY|nr:hypothetical protein [Halobium salinum]